MTALTALMMSSISGCAASPSVQSCIDNLTTSDRNCFAMLNPASPLPLYHQLAELLMAGISRGELAAGARLPSAPELSRVHRIGRPTVRQATELLGQRGRAERRRAS